MRITFPSLNSANIRYLVDGLDYYDRRDRKLGAVDWAREFDTLGDGETQHSPDTWVHEDQLPDFCCSILLHLQSHPEDLESIAKKYHFPQIYNKEILFFASLKYKEGKTQYFSRNEQKVSTSANKAHDKRWKEVLPWMDGSPDAVYALWLNGTAHDLLTRYVGFYKILRIIEQYDNLDVFFKLSRFSEQVIVAFADLMESVHLKNHAFKVLDSYLRDTRSQQAAA